MRRVPLLAAGLVLVMACASQSSHKRPDPAPATPPAVAVEPAPPPPAPPPLPFTYAPIDDPELDRADMLYAARISQEPRDPRGYMARALVRQRAGDLAASEDLYKACLHAQPDFGPAWANLGALLMEMERPSEAQEVLMQGAARAPEHAAIFANLAGALASTGRVEEAVSAAETAIDLRPKDSDLRRNLVALQYKAGLLSDAAKTLKQGVVDFPDEAPDFLMRLSEVQVAQGDDLAAAEVLERIIKLQPNIPIAYLRRAALLGRHDDLDGVIRTLVEGIHHNPDNEEIRDFFRAAMALRLQQDMAEAQARIKEDPRDVDAYLRMARIHEMGRDWRSALEILSAGVGENPASAPLWVHIGLLETNLKREREALAAYRRAMDADPKQPTAFNNCAYLLVTAETAELRNSREAMKLVRRALSLDPRNAAFLDTLAQVHFAQGDVKAARRAIGDALALTPEDPDLQEQAQRFDALLESPSARRQ